MNTCKLYLEIIHKLWLFLNILNLKTFFSPEKTFSTQRTSTVYSLSHRDPTSASAFCHPFTKNDAGFAFLLTDFPEILEHISLSFRQPLVSAHFQYVLRINMQRPETCLSYVIHQCEHCFCFYFIINIYIILITYS